MLSKAGVAFTIQRRSVFWLTLSIGLLFAAAAFVVAATTDSSGRSLPPPVAQVKILGVAGMMTTTSVPTASVLQTQHSTPRSIDIPAINLQVSLSLLGLNPDHSVQVPTNFAQPGWYDLGPSPGQIGSAVILGHVDSYRGPAVFFRLRDLVPGDQIHVTLDDGLIANFEVTLVANYPKVDFPSDQVYKSQGKSELQLVTCGGVFDSRTRSYLSNVIVYSSLISVTGHLNLTGTTGST